MTYLEAHLGNLALTESHYGEIGFFLDRSLQACVRSLRRTVFVSREMNLYKSALLDHSVSFSTCSRLRRRKEHVVSVILEHIDRCKFPGLTSTGADAEQVEDRRCHHGCN